MAYSTTNPPRLVWSRLTRGPDAHPAGSTTQGSDGRQGGQFWCYVSTDVSTVVDADGFFTNGYNLGIRQGDVMMVVERVSGGATTLSTMHAVSRCTATGGCDLADAVAVTSVTDSD